MNYIRSVLGSQATKIPKDLSLAIFYNKICTIPNLKPSFEGLKKTRKHINVLMHTCLCGMTVELEMNY